MSGRHRRPGDPYDVGYGKPPKKTRFKKGLSGNPNGRPRKKPDLYAELTRVLRDTVTVTIDGEPERITVQQALLLRLRDEALRGEVRAVKLLQKVVDAIPDSGGEYDHIQLEMVLFRAKEVLRLMMEELEREKANHNSEPTEAGNGE